MSHAPTSHPTPTSRPITGNASTSSSRRPAQVVFSRSTVRPRLTPVKTASCSEKIDHITAPRMKTAASRTLLR
jgi:hypothetical protein